MKKIKAQNPLLHLIDFKKQHKEDGKRLIQLGGFVHRNPVNK